MYFLFCRLVYKNIMATPKKWVQDVITCDDCGMLTQLFCNSCQISLCQDCVDAHKRKVYSKSRDVFLSWTESLNRLDLRYPLFRDAKSIVRIITKTTGLSVIYHFFIKIKLLWNR